MRGAFFKTGSFVDAPQIAHTTEGLNEKQAFPRRPQKMEAVEIEE